MIRWLVFCGVVCSGCDVFFQVHEYGHDAAGADAPDAAPLPACSKMSMLADDFENFLLDRMWPIHNSLDEAGGVVRFDMTQSSNGNLESNRFYDLRDDHIQLALTTTNFNEAGGDKIALVAKSTRPMFALTITRAGTNLRFDRIEMGTVLSLGSVTFDSTMHKYWRIANAGAVTTFETSPNATDFTVQAMAMNLDYVGFMSVQISTQTNSAIGGYFLDIDDVNGGTPIGNACPMTALVDRFDANAIAEQWARLDLAGGTISEHEGFLEMAFLQNVTTNTYLVAASIYDLTAAPFSVEIPQMIDFSPSSTQVFQMVATSPLVERAQFREAAGVLYALYDAPSLGNDIIIQQRPYDPIAHLWWRVRIDGAFTRWETSANGVVWDDWGSTQNLHGFARADVFFEIVTSSGTTSPGAVHLDNVDLPPP